MEGWNKIQSSLGSINFGQSASKIAKGFNNSVQATRERLGQIAPEEITELPQGTCPVLSCRILSCSPRRIMAPAAHCHLPDSARFSRH